MHKNALTRMPVHLARPKPDSLPLKHKFRVPRADSLPVRPARTTEERRRACVSSLQSEDEQHGLIALIAQLRCQRQSTFADIADAGKDGDVLFAIDLEGHGRCVEARPDI